MSDFKKDDRVQVFRYGKLLFAGWVHQTSRDAYNTVIVNVTLIRGERGGAYLEKQLVLISRKATKSNVGK